MVDCFETANNLYIITDLASGGELFDRIYEQGSFFERDAAKLIYTVVDALKYLHDNGIVHRDLKPENLLFLTPTEDSPLLIADFGLSKVIGPQTGDLLNTTCGTPNYMAPETFAKGGYGKPVDMWAIGVITFLLLSGYPPFNVSDDLLDFTPIINAKYSFVPEVSWKGVSDTGKDFIKKLLMKNPSERMTAGDALEHPWLAEFNAGSQSGDETDTEPTNLLPAIRENFNARKTFRKMVGLVRVINKVRLAGQESLHLPTDEDISQIQVIP
ncbi:Calcium/calmodulin-dependent protein kinase type I [Entomophthora muscae]|nr:Calcium/calmodulin-dependent protein kinase type I [Entomophthora muscae]